MALESLSTTIGVPEMCDGGCPKSVSLANDDSVAEQMVQSAPLPANDVAPATLILLENLAYEPEPSMAWLPDLSDVRGTLLSYNLHLRDQAFVALLDHFCRLKENSTFWDKQAASWICEDGLSGWAKEGRFTFWYMIINGKASVHVLRIDRPLETDQTVFLKTNDNANHDAIKSADNMEAPSSHSYVIDISDGTCGIVCVNANLQMEIAYLRQVRIFSILIPCNSSHSPAMRNGIVFVLAGECKKSRNTSLSEAGLFALRVYKNADSRSIFRIQSTENEEKARDSDVLFVLDGAMDADIVLGCYDTIADRQLVAHLLATTLPRGARVGGDETSVVIEFLPTGADAGNLMGCDVVRNLFVGGSGNGTLSGANAGDRRIYFRSWLGGHPGDDVVNNGPATVDCGAWPVGFCRFTFISRFVTAEDLAGSQRNTGEGHLIGAGAGGSPWGGVGDDNLGGGAGYELTDVKRFLSSSSFALGAVDELRSIQWWPLQIASRSISAATATTLFSTSAGNERGCLSHQSE